MKKTQILLASRPRMMREVVKEMIEAQPDMEVVGEVRNPVDLLVAVKAAEADAVILDLEDSEESGLISHLLLEYLNLTIVGVALNGRSAFVRPRRRKIGHTGPMCSWRRAKRVSVGLTSPGFDVDEMSKGV